MAAPFDPYYQWLSISPEEQPANFYRLLGVKLFEPNADVISSAADRQMTHVRSFSGGPNSALAQRLLNELSTARIMLLDANRKVGYDAMLRAATADEQKSQAEIVKAPLPQPVAAKGNAFGDFVVLQTISQATTGLTYKAQRRSDGQIVSLKVIPKELAKNDQFLKRLKREFELTRGVTHPHVVASYELGEAQGQPYLAFEYVGGADLGRVLTENGPLDVPGAIEVVKRVAQGLAYLHRKGIVHRNLKPQNILVNVQGTVKIANLTMARDDDTTAFLAGREVDLTIAGQTLGSPDFLAPEQAADSHSVDGRADLYSLGCTLYQLLTGRPPFEGKNAMQKLQAHRNAPIPSLRNANPEVPEWLDKLFQRLLAKKPADRPATAEAVVNALEASPGKSQRTTLMVAGAIAAAAILIVVVLILMRR